jgi:hypothetical protein
MTSVAAWPIPGGMPLPEALHTAKAFTRTYVRSPFMEAAR